MSVKNFSQDIFSLVLDSNEGQFVATHEIQEAGEINSLRVLVYVKGNPSGNLKLKVFPSGVSNVPICTSNTVAISDIGQNFFGWVRFDFSRQNIQSGTKIDIFCESSSYTRVGETDYVALIFDFPIEIYDNPLVGLKNKAIAIQDFFYT